ncbi:MAG: NAD(P)H-hydrate dehydratase [Ruminococcaceae bacterium]|nr:NAD(P)H-hydrate dehydratase [Oscillospiraceae bacterium]
MPTQLTADWVRQHLPTRPPNAHKGTFGTLQIVAGSRRYRGAAALAAEGALRAGTGVVQLAAIEPVCAAVAARLPCCTFLPVAQGPVGGIAAAALPDILAEKATAVLAGCGMGNTADTAALVGGLLAQSPHPLVLDADALNALAAASASRQSLFPPLPAGRGEIILTSHIGEMARLCGQSTEAILKDQPGIAQSFARRHGCTVVLKSHVTVVAAPSGALLVNNTAGNAGLAKGGSGDVLAGIIAGLLAQGLPAQAAAGAGVWLHATAADAAARETGQAALSPADLPHHLAQVLLALGH